MYLKYIYIYTYMPSQYPHTSSQKKMTRPIPSPHQVSAPVEGLGPEACQGLSQGAHLHVEHMTATSDAGPKETQVKCLKTAESFGK